MDYNVEYIMSKRDAIIRLSGTINPETEPALAEATIKLLRVYSISDLSKEGVRCVARREGLLAEDDMMQEAVPA